MRAVLGQLSTAGILRKETARSGGSNFAPNFPWTAVKQERAGKRQKVRKIVKGGMMGGVGKVYFRPAKWCGA